MNVVLEGPDAAGKSTLAKLMSEALDMRVQQGSGPPRGPGEIEDRAATYLGMRGVIFDRHPCVSQPIYAQLRDERLSDVFVGQLRDFYACDQLIVYCRPVSNRLKGHVVKDGEDPAHVEAVRRRYAELCSLYDQWGLARAHLIYRIGDSVEAIVDVVRVLAC